MYKQSIAVLAVASALTFTGCGGDESAGGGTGSDTNVATSVSWILDEAPADVQGVADAKKSAAEGDTIAIRGKIGGRMEPLSAESAIFVMMDNAIPSCADNPGDMCKTPWDYCCETPETISANNASVILVDEAGSALAVDLTDHGFAALDEVVVVGTVRARPSESVLAISATGIYKVGN